MNEITLSLETLTVQGIQALDPNDNYCPKQPICQNTAQCVGVAAVSAWRNARQRRSLYSDAETAVGANAYHSEKSPELAHQEDLRDRSQIHSRVLNLDQDTQIGVGNHRLFFYKCHYRYWDERKTKIWGSKSLKAAGWRHFVPKFIVFSECQCS